jgi:hypothetical protein
MVHYHKGVTTEWPNGLASSVVASLMKKYRPTDTISAVEYETALNDFKLKKKQDPTELFDHFDEVNTQFGITAPDENKLIALALRKLPEKYGQTFSTLTIALGGQVDLETFGEATGALHRATVKNGGDDSDSELNLTGVNGKKPGGKKGKWKTKNKYNKNKKTDDDDSVNNDDDEDGDGCPHCGRTGHEPEKCWMLKKNKSKRPDWFDIEKYPKKGNNKKTKEVSVVGHGPELLLATMSFPNSLKLLDDPNIWIADTGATCDSTPHDDGAVNIRKPGNDDSVTFGDGAHNDAKAIFDLPGVLKQLTAASLLDARETILADAA